MTVHFLLGVLTTIWFFPLIAGVGWYLYAAGPWERDARIAGYFKRFFFGAIGGALAFLIFRSILILVVYT